MCGVAAFLLAGLIFTGVIALASSLLSAARRGLPGALEYSLTTLVLSALAFVNLLGYLSPSLEAKIFWLQMRAIASSAFTGCSLLLVLWLVAAFPRRYPLWLLFVLFLPTAITAVIVLVEPLRPLLFSGFSLDTAGPLWFVRFQSGVWYYLTLLYLIGTYVLATWLFAWRWPDLTAARRRLAIWLCIGTLPAATVSILSRFEITPVPGYNWGIMLYGLALAVIAIGILRSRFLDPLPATYRSVMDHLDDKVLVFDLAGRLVYGNRSAELLLRTGRGEVDLDGEHLWQRWPPLQPFSTTLEVQTEVVLEVGGAARPYELTVSPILDGSHVTGRLVILHDVFMQRAAAQHVQELAVHQEFEHKLVDRLQEQGQRLLALYEILGSAGQAQDIHATLQHALNVIVQAFGAQAGAAHELRTGAPWASAPWQLTCACGLDSAQQHILAEVQPGWLADDAPIMLPELSWGTVSDKILRPLGFRSYLGAPMHLHGKTTGMLSLFWSDSQPAAAEDIVAFGVMADQVAVLIDNARLRQRFAEEAVYSERRRLARDLHDSVTQSLHGLLLNVHSGRRALANGDTMRLADVYTDVEECARHALKEMRLLLHAQRTGGELGVDSLIHAVTQRLDMVENRSGVTGRLSVYGTVAPHPECDRDLYWITNEALNNVLKHADASAVAVELHYDSEGLRLVVQDDGCGYDAAHAQPGGSGIINMRERAERLGGTFSIDGLPGRGACVTVWIPCRQLAAPSSPPEASAWVLPATWHSPAEETIDLRVESKT